MNKLYSDYAGSFVCDFGGALSKLVNKSTHLACFTERQLVCSCGQDHPIDTECKVSIEVLLVFQELDLLSSFCTASIVTLNTGIQGNRCH